jgi:hypothetical protein
MALKILSVTPPPSIEVSAEGGAPGCGATMPAAAAAAEAAGCRGPRGSAEEEEPCRREPRAYSLGSRILLASMVETVFEASDSLAPLAILLTETRSRKGRREASM